MNNKNQNIVKTEATCSCVNVFDVDVITKEHLEQKEKDLRQYLELMKSSGYDVKSWIREKKESLSEYDDFPEWKEIIEKVFDEFL